MENSYSHRNVVLDLTYLRSCSYKAGFGFSVIGGKGSIFPPVIFEIVNDSLAFNSHQLESGDVIISANGLDLSDLTTSHDKSVREKVLEVVSNPYDKSKILKAISQEDLVGVSQLKVHSSYTHDLTGFNSGITPLRHSASKLIDGPDYVENSLSGDQLSLELRCTKSMPSAVHLVGCRSLNNDEFYNGNHREVLENSSISNEVINLNHINSDCASISPTHKLNSSSHHKQPTNLVNNNSQKSSSPKSDNLHFNSPILGVNCRPPPTSPVTPDDAPMFFSSPPQASQNSSRVNLGRVFVSTGRKDSFERQGNSTYDEDDVLDPVELSMDDFTPGPKGSFDRPSADRLAKRLFNLDGFSLTAVAKQLSKKNEFAQMVSTAYFQYYDFTGIRVDEALRKFMSRFVFIGETQERERILNHFSARYFQCNPNVFPSHDSVDYLVCAIILLNQDLHGIVPHGGKRMTMNQFISNVLHPGPSDETFDEYSEFSKQLLKDIYNSVKSSPLQMADDDEENCQQVGNGKPPIQIPSTVLSPTSENGLSLHHYKSQRHISDLKLTVPLHHAFAHPAKHYSKKNHVFQLRTADLSEYLYQCKSDEEMSEWINAINLYAAYSAPPLPCGVSSAPSKPQRPLLPHHFTSYHVRDQIKQWEECVNKCDSDQMTSRLRMKAASSKSEVEDYEKHLQCLEVDHQRYHVYIERLLETTNRTSQAGSELPPEAWKSSSKNTQVNRLQTTFLPENSIDYGVL